MNANETVCEAAYSYLLGLVGTRCVGRRARCPRPSPIPSEMSKKTIGNAEADRRERLRRVLAEPERVRQIVGGLHQVRDDDR